MTTKLLSLYGLKYSPFCADIPVEALYLPPAVDVFLRRVERGLSSGGFAMLTGDPGTGKTTALRMLVARLEALPNVVVGILERPQSRPADFYRELGDVFGVSLTAHNRWAGFKALRSRWSEHIAATLMRPVLILDEAQATDSAVLSELRLLASKDFDSRQLLSVVFSGDARFPERLRTAELLPLGSRIRRRIAFDYASRDELLACLDHVLAAAGNSSLMTAELKATLADHSAGNYRVLMNLADELLTVAADRDLPRLDEKLFLDVFGPTPKPKSPRKR
ncbi:MAG: ExeA family protein [Candidatus Rokuibacteriota bacterium]